MKSIHHLSSSLIKILVLGSLFMTSQISNADTPSCPNQFQGEYRKLHATTNINLCDIAAGKVTLVINTASHCGFTPQFKGLEALHQKYKDKGLVLVGFASDDFNQEAKNEEEAAGICFENFGVTFTMLAPTHVKGKDANQLFQYLIKESGAPKWNFNKYLLDKNGKVIEHFGSMTGPDSSKLTAAIEKALH